jgi:glycosyltransferase involved in cell wall biosynthesis
LRPRLVHAHFGRGGALALPLARALGIPLVVTFHGGDATKEKHYRRGLVPTVFQRRLAALREEAALVICVSDFLRDRLVERGFPPEKLGVIRYGVETDDAGSPEAAPSHPEILFVGRFVEKKGVTHLVEAMRMLESQGSDLRLALIGDGPLRGALESQARSLKNVRFLGWLPQVEVRRRMRGHSPVVSRA